MINNTNAQCANFIEQLKTQVENAKEVVRLLQNQVTKYSVWGNRKYARRTHAKAGLALKHYQELLNEYENALKI